MIRFRTRTIKTLLFSTTHYYIRTLSREFCSSSKTYLINFTYILQYCTGDELRFLQVFETSKLRQPAGTHIAADDMFVSSQVPQSIRFIY